MTEQVESVATEESTATESNQEIPSWYSNIEEKYWDNYGQDDAAPNFERLNEAALKFQSENTKLHQDFKSAEEELASYRETYGKYSDSAFIDEQTSYLHDKITESDETRIFNYLEEREIDLSLPLGLNAKAIVILNDLMKGQTAKPSIFTRLNQTEKEQPPVNNEEALKAAFDAMNNETDPNKKMELMAKFREMTSN